MGPVFMGSVFGVESAASVFAGLLFGFLVLL
jgi:hypothetical protein